MAGEIHGLVGENGAGKSTTMKIIAGVHTEFDGVMKIKGREVRLRSAGDALANSIGMVHQELSVVPDLTVAENVFLGNQPLTAIGTVDWGRMNREAKQLIASLGLDIDPTTTMGSLPVGPAAAGRTLARAVLGRADHHSRRADLGPVAA